jgi:hypothetical protein
LCYNIATGSTIIIPGKSGLLYPAWELSDNFRDCKQRLYAGREIADNLGTLQPARWKIWEKGIVFGKDEEFAISASAVKDIKILSLNVEYLTLSLDVFTVIRLGLSAEEIRQRWLLKAWNSDEASRFALLSADLEAVVDRLFSRTMWHPTSRMRLIQYLFHTYGIDEVARAIRERKANP